MNRWDGIDSDGADGPSEFGGTPAAASRAANRSASDRLRNLRITGDEDQTHVTDAAADAIWEGLNP